VSFSFSTESWRKIEDFLVGKPQGVTNSVRRNARLIEENPLNLPNIGSGAHGLTKRVQNPKGLLGLGDKKVYEAQLHRDVEGAFLISTSREELELVFIGPTGRAPWH